MSRRDQLLRQYLEEGGVLIGHDGLVDAALGKNLWGISGTPDTAPSAPSMGQTLGEHQTLHLIILADAIVAAGRIEDPVADIHQISRRRNCFSVILISIRIHLHAAEGAFTVCNSITDPVGKYH